MSVVVDYEERRHRDLHEAVLRKSFDDPTVERLLALRSSRNYHLVARVTGVMFGGAVGVALDTTPGIVQVLAVGVVPSHRHFGIGRGLLLAMVEEARREHHRYVVAPGPADVFESLGWHEMEPPKDALHASPQVDGVTLERWWSTPTRTLRQPPLVALPPAARIAPPPLGFAAR